MELKIDPEFQKLIPPLSDDELEQLEKNILTQGKSRDAIKVWQNTIIDGHHRYTICQKHIIPYEVEKIRLGSREEALIWIIENQLGKRNLTPAARIDLILQKKGLSRQRAKENLSKAGKGLHINKADTINVRKEVADEAGYSENTVYKFMKIKGSGSKDLTDRVKKGELSINKAYNNMLLEVKKVEVVYDSKDPKYKKIAGCRENVLKHLDALEKLYDSIINSGETVRDLYEAEKLVVKLEGHLRVIERISLKEHGKVPGEVTG